MKTKDTIKKLIPISLLISIGLGIGGTTINTNAQSNQNNVVTPKQSTRSITNQNVGSNTVHINSGIQPQKKVPIISKNHHKNRIVQKITKTKKNPKTSKENQAFKNKVWHIPLLRINKNTSILKLHRNKIIDTGRNISKGVLVKPSDVTANSDTTFIKIDRAGKTIGWVNVNDLSRTNLYKLPYKYTSQFWPSRAKDACEIASLKTALSADGKTNHISLSSIVNRIPLNSNPNLGYTGNPYRYGTHATINPMAMVNISKEYGARAKDISGSQVNKFVYEVTHGNPVIFESPFMMKRPNSDHDLTILGYRPGYFYVVDPFAAYRSSRRGTWVSEQRVSQLYNSVQRDQHAMVIYTP